MLTHRGFSAWIVIDGKPVPEYLVAEDSKAARVQCWIPSEAGQKFVVHWKDHDGGVDTCAFIGIDGLLVPGRYLFGTGETYRGGVRSSEDTERPFMFQKVEEDSDHAVNKDIGTITLRIKRIKRGPSRPANTLQHLPSVLGKRKAGDIRAGFGEDTRAYDQYPYTWSVRPYEDDVPATDPPRTYVSFVFRYRSREFLQTQGIMPESDEVKPTVTIRAPMRRVSSAPPMPAPEQKTLPLTPRASPGPPQKRSRTEQKPYLPLGPTGNRRRPSADVRRTVSYQITPTMYQVAEAKESVDVVPLVEEDDYYADGTDWTA